MEVSLKDSIHKENTNQIPVTNYYVKTLKVQRKDCQMTPSIIRHFTNENWILL